MNIERDGEVVATYDYYTLDQARKIIKAEMRQKHLSRKMEEQKRKREIMIDFKFWGTILFLIIMAIATTIILKDCTFALLIVLFMTFGICSKGEVIDGEGEKEN